MKTLQLRPRHRFRARTSVKAMTDDQTPWGQTVALGLTWAWPRFDLALIRIYPTWQCYDNKYHIFVQLNSCQKKKARLLLWTELPLLFKKKCKRSSVPGFLAQDTCSSQYTGEVDWCKGWWGHLQCMAYFPARTSESKRDGCWAHLGMSNGSVC